MLMSIKKPTLAPNLTLLAQRTQFIQYSEHNRLTIKGPQSASAIFDAIEIITGAQPKAGTGHKMQTVSVVFQRYIVRDISLTEIYCWLVTFARSLIEILSAILKSTRHGGQSRERL